MRFLVVSLVALGANLAHPRRRSSRSGVDKILAQAIAIVLVTPLNFVGNKLWSFRDAAEAPSGRCAASSPLAVAVLALAARALAPRRRRSADRARVDATGRLVQAPFAPAGASTQLTKEQATAHLPRVPEGRATGSTATRRTTAATDATFNEGRRLDGERLVGPGRRDRDRARSTTTSGAVTEAWTGPQVAWKMARGYDGAFGGKEINSLPVWLGFCALFLFGLADLRRPLSLRNLDLLALLSFSVSLWYFNHGDVFTSVPLAYPPLALPARAHGLDRRAAGAPADRRRPVWPVWLLAAATVFLGRLPHRPQRPRRRT